MKPPMSKNSISKISRAIAITTVITLVVISAINLTISTISWFTYSPNLDAFNELVTNWGQTTVLDVKVDATCPTGYTPAIGRKWSGTDQSCYCGDSTAAQKSANYITCNNFCSGACTASMLNGGCVNVGSSSSKTLSYWQYTRTPSSPSSQVNAQICVKRSDESWLTNGIFSGGACPTGYKACGKSDETKFCTKYSTCPIIGLSVVPVNSVTFPGYPAAAVNAGCATGASNCSIYSNDGTTYKILGYQRMDFNDSMAISQFALNEYAMCTFSWIDNVTPGRSQYFPLHSKPTSCGTVGDSSWGFLDNKDEASLFQINDLTTTINSFSSYVNNNMNGYYTVGASGTDYNWKLYQRPYIPWKAASRDKMEKLLNNTDKIDAIYASQKGYFIATVVCTFFLVVLILLELMNLFAFDHPYFDGSNEFAKEKLRKYKLWAGYFFLAIQIPFQIWNLILVAAVKSFFDDLGSGNYSAPIVNENFAHFATNFSTGLRHTIVSLVLTLACIVLYAIMQRYYKKAVRRNTFAATKIPSQDQSPITPHQNAPLSTNENLLNQTANVPNGDARVPIEAQNGEQTTPASAN